MREYFLFCKDEEESGLPPADNKDAAGQKINRKDICYFMGEQYYVTVSPAALHAPAKPSYAKTAPRVNPSAKYDILFPSPAGKKTHSAAGAIRRRSVGIAGLSYYSIRILNEKTLHKSHISKLLLTFFQSF